MRLLRSVGLAVAMAAAFLYLTSVAKWDVGKVLRPIQNAGRVWSEPASAATTYAPDEQNNIDVYRAARDATVNITSTVYTRDMFLQLVQQKGTGTGFIINPDGQILTNFHVVSENPRELSVTLSDKKVYKAKVLGYDAKNDLALVKIDAPGKLPTLRLGDSDNLLVGQKVLAIGNPFQFEGTLTTGIVSSVGRDIDTDERRLEGMIQTDAAINPGNSGGPLLDSHGNVIGINTAIYGSQGSVGIGFAMPIARAKAMLGQYQSHGDISPAAPIGITSIYVAGDVADMLRLPVKGGLLVQGVEGGTAADAAGLRGPDSMVRVGNYRVGVGGDLIMAVDGRQIESNATLPRVLNDKRGGDMVELTIYRRDHTEKIKLKLEKAPQKL